ncbi:very-long-chain 3-oxoacyl-CoA reductase 1 isoform X2 [Populus alba]|uniref:very-long-chain 3-oxoacyl-CoA reductase 1 isoform X2 n=1 Tax=Populus alba TaxID=43335 RepID=UPI003CC6FBF2
MVSACINHLLSQPMWLVLVSSLGLLSFLKTSTSLLKWVYATFLRPKKNLRDYGSWALITGATDGIGKAFAHRLAQRDLNLILVGRNPTKLETVSREIQAEHPGTKIKTVVFDFSSEASAGVRSIIEKATEGLDVGLLINNLGITYPAASFFHEVDEKVWMDIVRVNLVGSSRVTQAVLAGMIERKRGAIINIGSGAASAMPSHPLFTIYAATKAYIDQLSRCLYVEYKRCGIHVQCQAPCTGTAICCNKNDCKSSFDSEIILVHTITRSLRRGCDWSSRLRSTVCSLLGSLVSMVAGLLASRARS